MQAGAGKFSENLTSINRNVFYALKLQIRAVRQNAVVHGECSLKSHIWNFGGVLLEKSGFTRAKRVFTR